MFVKFFLIKCIVWGKQDLDNQLLNNKKEIINTGYPILDNVPRIKFKRYQPDNVVDQIRDTVEECIDPYTYHYKTEETVMSI